jgi:hypothetical protein
MNKSRQIARYALYLIVGYALFFGFRIWYSYSLDKFDNESGFLSGEFFNQLEVSGLRNIAGEKYKRTKETKSDYAYEAPANGGFEVIEQKYEKTATVRSRSYEFEKDEKKLRGEVKRLESVIQFEKNAGERGERELHLLVGVKPEQFDTFYDIARKIGKVGFAEIEKTDKTSEYKDLNARRTSLENTRKALTELKARTGSIGEFINLENRILNIDSSLQELGVQLGDFSEENEFCTMKISLFERRVPVPTSFMHRLKVSFEWATTWYPLFLIVLGLCFGVGFLLVLLLRFYRGNSGGGNSDASGVA